MITRSERDELLSDSGLTDEELRLVFSVMGVDYDSEEFEDDIIETVLKTAEELGLAVNKVKRLNAATPEISLSTEIVTQQISEMMFQSLEEQGRSFPVEAVLALVQVRAERYVALSKKVNEIAKRAYKTAEAREEIEFLQEELGLATRSRDVLDELLSDEGQQEIIASLMPSPSPSRLNEAVRSATAALVSKRKANAQIEGKRVEQVKALPSQDLKQLRGAFLASMKG